ncbi:MAG: hypothetical protein IJ493_01415 [Clostridia bacterium]|nr:hypothetical protein [Clostridia bacterium]
MLNQFKRAPICCLLLCLFLVGCGGESDDGTPEVTRIEAVTRETDAVIVTKPAETDTKTSETSTDTSAETEPAADTEPVTEKAPDTEPVADTESAAQAEETTAPADTGEAAPDVDTTVDADDVIDLSGSLSAGNSVTGKFVSDQSEKLRLVVNYDCHMEADGGVTIDFEVGLESYDINCGARVDTGKLIVDGTEQTFSTDAIAHEGRTLLYTPFASYTYANAEGQTSCGVNASWIFNGSYAGVRIDTLTASATLKWEADAD